MSETQPSMSLDELRVLLNFQATVRANQKTPEEIHRDGLAMEFMRHTRLASMIHQMHARLDEKAAQQANTPIDA
jgi:hypothetical protein